MKQQLTFAALAVFSLGSTLHGGPILYDNTTVDTFGGYSFVVNGWTQIGDRITLGGPGSLPVGSVSVQFFNGGTDATFDAILQFWEANGPVGPAIGSSYSLRGINLVSGGVQTATFGGLSLQLPGTVVFTIRLENVSVGADIGLTAFDPPAVGSSDNSRIVVHDGSGFAESLVSAGQGNLYLQMQAVPEPSSLFLGAVGLGICVLAKRMRTGRASG